MSSPGLVLASGSPRRKELLKRFGVPFEAVNSGVDEDVPATWPPHILVRELSRRKAAAVANSLPAHQPVIVLGADTVVDLGGAVLGKPEDRGDAVRILMMLSGRPHSVATGIALIDPSNGRSLVSLVETAVFMRPFDRSEAERYVAGGEPMDKAGAYAIQGQGGLLVERIEGCFNNVMGLPLCELGRMLNELTGFRLGEGCFDPNGQPCPRGTLNLGH